MIILCQYIVIAKRNPTHEKIWIKGRRRHGRDDIAIAEFLDTELAKFDTLTAEAQRAIDLLQERRTALISAAVTGQIDVRQSPL